LLKSFPGLLIHAKSSNFVFSLSLLYTTKSLKHIYHILLFAGILSQSGIAAQQNNNWYFGRRGAITFNPVSGQSLPSMVTNSKMDSDEGTSTISDNAGKLLFYCNGVTVYNKLHNVMLNGNNLKGNISACQSSVIVPCPGNDSIFYLFTTDAIENSFLNGYCYSIININHDNGNGEVISKNNLLVGSCTERLVAARHANGIDLWIVTNDEQSHTFRSWLMTCNGLQTPEVISIVGDVLNSTSSMGAGMMKVSPDGKYLCQTHFPEYDEVTIRPNFCQLFDFDNVTGKLSNVRKIQFPNAQITTCEFSPDSKLLYLTRPFQYALEQVECTLPTVAAIIASRKTIPIANKNYYGIQLAPDGKIYLCAQAQDHLDVISKPNLKGSACNFSENAVTLNGFYTYLGLPAFVNDVVSDDPSNNFNYTITDTCAGAVQFSAQASLPGNIKWEWDFGDGQTGTTQNPAHAFNPSNKTFIVKLTISSNLSCGKISRSKYITINAIEDTLNFDEFKRCDSGYVRFITRLKVIPPDAMFTWTFGDNTSSNEINPVHHYPGTGVYIVKLFYQRAGSCQVQDFTKTVDFRPFPISVSGPQTIVYGQTIQLHSQSPVNNYQWTPATGLNNTTSANPMATPLTDIIYKVTSRDQFCESSDSIKITVVDLDDIYVPSAFTPNHDGKNDKLIPFIGSKYKLEEFSVFNRWGTKIYTTKNRGEGWDGHINAIEQSSGVFIYYVRVSETGKKPVEKKGTVTLIQ
jgi:gliding motility-associated-like protein